jgi:uncharacterized membrane protein YdbT with pleckstrin-like domain
MAYIKKTLTENEEIISQNKFHWWFLAKEIFYLLLLIIPAFYFQYLGVLGPSAQPYFMFAMLFFALSVWPALRLLYSLIIRLTTEQVLTNKRVFRKTGIISRDTDELTKEKVETVSINQSILGRILNFGDIEFTGTGGIKIIFTYVKNPTKVKKQFE